MKITGRFQSHFRSSKDLKIEVDDVKELLKFVISNAESNRNVEILTFYDPNEM